MKKVKSKNTEYSLEIYQKCPICYSFYSSTNNPHVLPCGHSFCFSCILKIYNSEENYLQCALDKRNYEFSSIEEIPVNFSFLQILQAISALKINENCKFNTNNEHRISEMENNNLLSFKTSIEEFSKCKTVLELNFLQTHKLSFLNSAKKIIYERKFPNINNYTIYEKFCESKKFMTIKKNLYENGEYYEGMFLNGKKHGWGKKRYLSGIVYEGFFNGGNKEGYGIEISKNLDIYIGEFENNLKSGTGISFSSKQNSCYEGKFSLNKRHGEGKETFMDGSYYLGEFTNGMRNGPGYLNFANGNFLKGDFHNGKLDGEGKEKTDNYRYKGEFREGLKHGYGILVYNNGNMYKGHFVTGKMHGKGYFKYNNGNIYEGDYFENKKHGDGKFEIMSKADNKNCIVTYTGQFINDYFEGHGTLFTKNKSMYKGDFISGLKDGFGILKYANGDEYRGSFERDLKSGKGEIFYADSLEVIRGIWKNNKLFSEENIDLTRIQDNELDDISMLI